MGTQSVVITYLSLAGDEWQAREVSNKNILLRMSWFVYQLLFVMRIPSASTPAAELSLCFFFVKLKLTRLFGFICFHRCDVTQRRPLLTLAPTHVSHFHSGKRARVQQYNSRMASPLPALISHKTHHICLTCERGRSAHILPVERKTNV